MKCRGGNGGAKTSHHSWVRGFRGHLLPRISGGAVTIRGGGRLPLMVAAGLPLTPAKVLEGDVG